MLPVLGICAFSLFFLSDYNDWKGSWRGLRFCFPAGTLLLACVTAAGCLKGTPFFGGPLRIGLALLAALFLALLVYTLFFALPVKASYAAPGEDRPVCAAGVYALCRHPGVLWFAGLYLCLWAAFGLPLSFALLCTGLNVALVVFEDRRVFPARLSGYDDYRRTPPILQPTARSIRACFARH